MNTTIGATLLACTFLLLSLLAACKGDESGTPANSSQPDGNTAPQVDPTAEITRDATVQLRGSVRDETLPHGRLTIRWTQVSGPGPVEFADPSRPDTSATFTVPGTYVLRLTATDGEFTVSDDVTIEVRR